MTTIHDDLRLFALGSSRAFGEQVARSLGIALSQHEERYFEDGEHKARPLQDVRGCRAFVLDSLYADQEHSSNDKLCRMLFFIGALKDAGAARVTAVVPYLAYARKDRKTKPNDPVTTRYVAAMFESVGTDGVLTLDVHNLAAFQNAFRCQTGHLEAAPLFVAHFARVLDGVAAAVVSPDAGGSKRAEGFRRLLGEALGAPVGAGYVNKYRSGGELSGETLVGEVRGMHAVIVDDMISTGTTMLRAARACMAAGASAVSVAATHGLFNGDAPALLEDDAFTRIVVTDSVPPFRLAPGLIARKVTVLDCAPLLAQAIG